MDTPGSPKYALNFADLWKTVRGGLIILASVGLTAILAFVSDQYMHWNYAFCATQTFCMDLRIFFIPIISSLLELGRRYVSNLQAQ